MIPQPEFNPNFNQKIALSVISGMDIRSSLQPFDEEHDIEVQPEDQAQGFDHVIGDGSMARIFHL